jgi:hypothetical protein
MTTDSITTKAFTAAISTVIKPARLLIKSSRPLDSFVYMTPPRGRLLYAVGNRCAGVAMPLAERLISAGEALEYWAASMGARHGIEV